MTRHVEFNTYKSILVEVLFCFSSTSSLVSLLLGLFSAVLVG